MAALPSGRRLRGDGSSLDRASGAGASFAATRGGHTGCARAVPAPETPPLLAALRRLLGDLRMRCSPQAGRPFLGAGASGRVFRVETTDSTASAQSQRLALKVVVGRGSLWELDLTREFGALEQAYGLGAPVVAPVPGARLLDTCGGFLMQCVDACVVVASASACRRAFSSLRELHARRIVHGDARLPNLLHSADNGTGEATMVWADLDDGVQPGSTPDEIFMILAQQDARALAASILGRREGSSVNDAVVASAVDAYDVSEESAVQLAAAVWSARE